MAPGQVFIVSAPSGAGKTTLIQRLMRRVEGLEFSISHTSRPPRPGEADGVHYHFVTPGVFRRMVEEGAFAEWAEVHGNLYGTSFKELEERRARGRDVILDIDVQGEQQLRNTLPEAVRIFIAPPSLEELERRLVSRGETRETIDRRIANARMEMERANGYTYTVVNEHLAEALESLIRIVGQERAKRIGGTPGPQERVARQ